MIYFDFDGTLCDSLDTFLAVCHRFYGLDTSDKETLRSLSSHEFVKKLGIPWWKLPFEVRRGRKAMQKELTHLHLFPGIKDGIDALRKEGIFVGVLTTNSESVCAALFAKELVAVDDIVSSSSFFGKAIVLKRLGKEGLYVGDETRDIEAAQRAGWGSAAVSWGYTKKNTLSILKPDFLLSCPQELKCLSSYFSQICNRFRF